MSSEPKGSLESLARSAREERARAEADARDKVSGRKGRRSHKTPREHQVGTRISAEHRQKLEWLAETTGKSFGRLFEEGIELLVKIEQQKTKGR
jgi:hypothetical protein